MADEIDAAQDAEERLLAAALRARRPTAQATGFCLHCNDVAPANAVYCSPDCRSDHEWLMQLKRLSGR